MYICARIITVQSRELAMEKKNPYFVITFVCFVRDQKDDLRLLPRGTLPRPSV